MSGSIMQRKSTAMVLCAGLALCHIAAADDTTAVAAAPTAAVAAKVSPATPRKIQWSRPRAGMTTLKAGDANAINPQPLPPFPAPVDKSRQRLSTPGQAQMINPQPLPPDPPEAPRRAQRHKHHP
ncbi:MAG: hypothetical protein QM808_07310 [Steroidobacteraceae bacterium]